MFVLRRQWYRLQDQVRRWRWRTRVRLALHPGAANVSYHCFAGLANRLRAHVGALGIALPLGRSVVAAWPRNQSCAATADEILDTSLYAQAYTCTGDGILHAMPDPDALRALTGAADRHISLDHLWQYRSIGDILAMTGNRMPVADLLRFHPTIRAQAQARGLDAALPMAVGVHIRRGDFATRTGQARPVGDYVRELAAIRSATTADILNVYLATDGGEAVFDQLRQQAPFVRILNPPMPTSRQDVEGIRMAACEMLALSRCRALLVTRGSSFGEIAMHLGAISDVRTIG